MTQEEVQKILDEFFEKEELKKEGSKMKLFMMIALFLFSLQAEAGGVPSSSELMKSGIKGSTYSMMVDGGGIQGFKYGKGLCEFAYKARQSGFANQGSGYYSIEAHALAPCEKLEHAQGSSSIVVYLTVKYDGMIEYTQPNGTVKRAPLLIITKAE